MIAQLAAYGALWIVFPLLVFSAARWRGWRAALASHLLVVAVIVALDLRWIASHGLQAPQTPLGVALAIALRAFLANVILLPISIGAIKLPRVG